MVEAQVSLNDGTTVFLTLPHRHIPETEGAVSAAQHLQVRNTQLLSLSVSLARQFGSQPR